tara:strand:+ start:665 stop:1507 length:843 start_codon:yes stop_codon:yes gene_type:complete
MKTTYVYFGTKGYYTQDGVVQTGSNVAALTAVTIADDGLLLKVKANSVATNTLDYRVLIKGGDAVTAVRGTDYTHDFVTGQAFDAEGVWGADLTQDDKQVGQVTELTGTDAYIVGSANEILTIGDNVASGTAGVVATGFLMTTNDEVYFEQTRSGITVGNGPEGISGLSGAYTYPMTNFLGANPIAYGKIHYDGTVLDKTQLHFVNNDGTGTDDIITLIHTAGKYPDIVKTFEAINNCGIYDRALTFYDLDQSGNETFLGGPTLSGNNDLGIVGCWRTVA